MTTSREVFLSQCKRRFGRRNPQRMRLEHWEWMVRHGRGPNGIRRDLGVEPNWPSLNAGADWCFSRFGMTETTMDDGRIICVAGEHEDSYDPDFCIYNDVIILRPEPGQSTVTLDSGSVEIYGYPAKIFPPTDFHSATLVGNRLFVIGRLGYSGKYKVHCTPVYVLDTNTYEITKPEIGGDDPGWIYKHHASFDPATYAITVRGGKPIRPELEDPVLFRGLYRLHLADMRWEMLCECEEPRHFVIEAMQTSEDFEVVRADDFKPVSVPHTWVPVADRGGVECALDVAGVRVTFINMYYKIVVTIEGTLQRETRDALLTSIVANLNRRGALWELREADGTDQLF